MGKELRPLIGGQNAQVAKQGGTLRAENVLGDVDKQHFKIAQHAPCDIVIKSIARVLDAKQQPLSPVGDQREWEVCLSDILEGPALPFAPERLELRVEGQMLVDNDALEQRSATLDVAPALHLCKRRMLMRTRRHILAANSRQPPHEFCGWIYVDTHRKRVDQNANDVVGSGDTGPSACSGCAKHDIALTA